MIEHWTTFELVLNFEKNVFLPSQALSGVMLGLSWVDLRTIWVNLGGYLALGPFGMVWHSWAHFELVGPIWAWLAMLGHGWAHGPKFGRNSENPV